jgi:CRISPR-associated protein Csd1
VGEDKTLWLSWIGYYSNTKQDKALCYVTGKELLLADQHSAKLRNDGDKAKLISSNDTSGFTFRGRFVDANQACGVGFEVSQKAHSALRWLISRQGYRSGQAIVAWATSGKEVPDPLADPLSILGDEELAMDDSDFVSTAQNIALKFNKKMAGYKADLGDTSGIVVMGLDSATPGRMAITFYRELTGSDFLKRIEQWHETCAWVHNYRFIESNGNKKRKKTHLRFVGAPAPKDIAEAAYGTRADDNLKKATVERLLPCIIDGQGIPRDIVDSAVRRASNRAGMEEWEWNKTLSIACALFRKLNENGKEGYSMALDESRKTRDYLYGRLLALADSLEQWALNKAGEDRQTNAARLMHRFADHPYSTWKNIELSLVPYKARLGGQSQKRQALIDKVHSMFGSPEDYISDKKLSGEFLLGYHCQREALRQKGSSINENEPEIATEIQQ